MEELNIKGKKVTVMGLGLHGGAVGTVKWLYRRGAKITVTDTKTDKDLSDSLKKLEEYRGINYVLGEHRPEDFEETDLIIKNPGVRKDNQYLQIARKARVPIEMDSSLFFSNSPSQKIIGVTGSKGKTMTTKVITALLRAAQKQVVEVGTDGVSPLAELKNVNEDTTVVFELSSWRLEALAEQKISPPVAVVTSIYPEHLNTYKSMAEYIKTKKTIFEFQDKGGVAILNGDDEEIKKWGEEIKGKLFWYGVVPVKQNKKVRDGVYVEGKWIVKYEKGEREQIVSVSDVPVPHEHELRNVLPGILLALRAGIGKEELAKGIRRLIRLPHRLEEVGEVGGVRYINDSAATMPEATLAALESFKDENIVHILGGGDKELSFVDLVRVEKQAKIRALIFLPGEATEKIKVELNRQYGGMLPAVLECKDMKEAVMAAQNIARKGDMVLLSPAATSFGLFLHEFDRGEKFRQAVGEIQGY